MKIDFIFHNNYGNYKRFKCTDAKPFEHIMLLISSGRISYSFGGGETFFAGEKEIVYFPPGLRYSRRIEEPISFHQFKFNVSDGGNALAHLKPGKLMIRHHLVEQIALDTGLALSLPETEQKCIFENLIGNIIYDNYLFSVNLEKKTIHDRDVLFAIQYFRDHMAEKIIISSIAGKRNLTHTGFILKFRRCTGKTPIEYLTDLRISRARELLSCTDMSIADIAETCGFSNSFYFSNTFKKRTEFSPTQYRNLIE